MKSFLGTCVLWVLANFSFACAPGSIPVQYVKAIESQDVDKMAAFMSDEIRYHDPTMAYFDIPEIDLLGREATAKFWADSFRDSELISMSYTISDCFSSGPTTVLNLELSVDVAGETWGVDKAQIRLSGTHIMSLKLEQNRIVHQTDYVDYNAIMNQVARLQKEFGVVPRK